MSKFFWKVISILCLRRDAEIFLERRGENFSQQKNFFE